MKRRYAFADTELGQLRYWFCYLAFANRGGVGQDGQPKRASKDDHRSEAKILRALKAIGVPHPEASDVKPGTPDNRMRILQPVGGTIELDQPDFKRLQDYVEAHQWAPVLTDVAMDLEDSLDADSEKVEAS